MKNLVMALMIAFGLCGFSFAGDCGNGLCTAAARPVRKVVNITKEIVVAPVRAVVAVATPASNSCCETVATSTPCDCGCSTSKREVVKYQPLRRRLVNRSTTVSCCQ